MDEDPGSPGPPPLQDQNGMEVKAPVQKSARPAQQDQTTHRIIKQKERRRVDLTELNPHIVCAICSGYLIDPVTVVECLHSFCKSCIIKHVDGSKFCPTCDIQIHKTKPLLSLRSDKALQDIVYKVVPGLYRTEMQNRVKFYSSHPEAEPSNSEDAGEVADSLFFSPEDDISMSIEYFDNFKKTDDINKNGDEIDLEKENPNRRFLQCPGSVTVHHLKKFIMTKYSLDQSFLVDVIYKEDLLPEDNTLIDVAYSYNWRKTSPMRFFYRIYQKTKVLTRKRKKKKTKTNSKSHPAKKRRTIDSTPSFNNVETRQENGMEIDDEESKKANISPKLKSDGSDAAKAKINSVKDKDAKKVDPIKVNPIKVNQLKANASKVIPQEEAKSVKSATINHSTSLPTHKVEKPQQKAKPISPPLKAVKAVMGDKKPKSPPVLVRSVPVSSETPSQSNTTTTVSQNPIKPSAPQPSKKSSTLGTSVSATNKTTLIQTKAVSNVSNVSNGKAVTSVASDTSKKNTSAPSVSVKESVKEKVSQPIQTSSLATTTVTATTTTTATTKDKVVTNGHKVDTSGKVPEKEVVTKVTSSEKYLNKIVPDSKKPTSEKEVVEISVEVSASDVKKVLEKKKAEKDARMMSNGEERLYSNYSIVDQLKKGAAAANLARQKKQASMMDFTRTSEALNAPKVPPIIQGLQPKVTSASETNVLSAIVHSLAQKQQSLNQKIQAVTSNSDSKSQDKSKDSTTSVADSITKEKSSAPSEATKPKPSEVTKTLGTIVAPALSTKTSQEKPTAQKPMTTITPKLPGSTSIKPITKESRQSPTSVETTGSKGQQMLNFYKNNFPKTTSAQEATKSTETLTKNIPAGTTVTVKTVENKQTKASSPSATPTTKNSAFRMNLSNSNYSLAKQVTNPYSSVTAASQPALMNPLLHSQMSMALAAQHAQYLNFSNQHQQIAAAAALSAQVEAVAHANYINNTAANLVRAAAAAQITQPPMTTLAFTKPISSYDEHRFGLKIPQPNVSRHHSPSVSSFGTSRLQVKVNSDSPKSDSPKSSTKSESNNSTSANTSSRPGDGSNTTTTNSQSKISSGTHSMPAMLPFHGVKKVQALPKSVSQSGRSLPISSFINKNQNNTSTKSPPLTNSPPKSPVVSSKPTITSASSIQSLTDSNPFKTSAPVKQITTNLENSLGKLSATQPPINLQNPYKPVTQTNSLKKLVADLNSVQQKNKTENILNSLKKNSENKLLSESKKSFLGIDRNKNEKPKEVTTS